MFFKVIGKLDSVDEYGRHFIDVFHIKENEKEVTVKDGQVAIKFSPKYKALAESLAASVQGSNDARVYHCSTYEWNYKGKKGTSYYCFKIQEVNDYYDDVERFKTARKRTF